MKLPLGLAVQFLIRRNFYSRADKALERRVALITGSTSGIGKGIAESLAKRGCHVIINGFGDQDQISKLCADLASSYSVRTEYVGADLSKLSEIENLHEAIMKLFPEGLDILVNSAGLCAQALLVDGYTAREPYGVISGGEVGFDDLTHVVWSLPPDQTLPATHEAQGAVLFVSGWGRIINISSAHGHVASANKSAYVSAKHGLIGLTKVVAVEVAGSGVTCNAICPGYVETPLFVKQVMDRAKDQGISTEEAKSQIVSVHSSKEPVKIEQIGEIAAFLCSPAADQILGASIMVEGGWTIK